MQVRQTAGRIVEERPFRAGLSRGLVGLFSPLAVFSNDLRRLASPPADSPPSLVYTCPVKNAASSEVRYANMAATSSGEACRPSGIFPFTSASIASEYSARCIAVNTYPGATAHTRTFGANSRAIDLVSSITAALVAL